MKTVIVTGAAGFTGTALVESLRRRNTEVYAVVRPNSIHNKRLESNDKGLHVIPLELSEIIKLRHIIETKCECFFHLGWDGEPGFGGQAHNIQYVLDAVAVAADIGCKRFICTGSHAEYGVVPPGEITSETRTPMPVSAYGSAKVASCYLSRQLAEELGVEWIWGRIFSLIGKNEPDGRMLPELYRVLKKGEVFHMSSCLQNWDYLDVNDAADALVGLAERGENGEIYNIARGDFRPLKDYTNQLKEYVGTGNIIYGKDAAPFISLQPSVDKIRRVTEWYPSRTFIESVRDYELVPDEEK